MAAPAAVGVLCLLLNVQAEPQAAGRRHARLPPRRFPAERLVPEGFRGPNVLEKLAAGTHGDDAHAENLAFLIEHMGHAMKAQDAKTRRLREEGRAEQQQGGRRLAGEYKPITDSEAGGDGFCGSHGWALQQKPDKEEFADASLPCGEGGVDYLPDSQDGSQENPYGCKTTKRNDYIVTSPGYDYVTAFPDATTENGVTFDYFIAWGWSNPTASTSVGMDGWKPEVSGPDNSPYLAGCVYAKYDKGLRVNVEDDGTVTEDPIEIGIEGITCEGCKVNMGVNAQLAFSSR